MKLREDILNIISSGKGTLEIEFELTQLFQEWALAIVGSNCEIDHKGEAGGLMQHAHNSENMTKDLIRERIGRVYQV